jgi:hypothetical protein
MPDIRRDEIRTGEEYERVRTEERRDIAELKRHRRVALGDLLSLVFENRETIRSVIEEVIRAERITDSAQVAGEVDAFNAVVPPEGQLGATLYIEVADQAELGTRLEELEGIEDCVYVEVAGVRADGVPRAVAHPDEPPSAFYIGFSLSAEQRGAWLSGAAVFAGVEHASVRMRIQLDGEQRGALAKDLKER